MKKLLERFVYCIVISCCISLSFSCRNESDEKFRAAPPLEYTPPFNFCGEFVKNVENLSGLAYYDNKLGIWFIETDEKEYYYICCVANSFLHDWNVEVNYKGASA